VAISTTQPKQLTQPIVGGGTAMKSLFWPVLPFLLSMSIGQHTNAQTCSSQSVIVTVLNESRVPILDLQASNFRAASRRQTLTVGSASFRQYLGARTYVLLNTSANMAGIGSEGINKWRIARSAALEFISTAPPQARISLLTYSSTIGKEFDSSGRRQPMLDWLNSPESDKTSSLKGRSALYWILGQVELAMGPAQTGDAIYIITDGSDFTVSSIARRVSAEMESRRVRLFALILNDGFRPAALTDAEGDYLVSSIHPVTGSTELSNLVRASGGYASVWLPGGRAAQSWLHESFDYDRDAIQNIRSITRLFTISIDNFYLLTVNSAKGFASPEAWKLGVVDSDGKNRNNVTLAYPEKLQGCSDPSAR
jgi:hypothetical protein